MKIHVLKPLEPPLGSDENTLQKIGYVQTLLELTLACRFTKNLTGSERATERSSECPIHTYNVENTMFYKVEIDVNVVAPCVNSSENSTISSLNTHYLIAKEQVMGRIREW